MERTKKLVAYFSCGGVTARAAHRADLSRKRRFFGKDDRALLHFGGQRRRQDGGNPQKERSRLRLEALPPVYGRGERGGRARVALFPRPLKSG